MTKKFNETLEALKEQDHRHKEQNKKFNEAIPELRNLKKQTSEKTAYTKTTSLTLEKKARTPTAQTKEKDKPTQPKTPHKT